MMRNMKRLAVFTVSLLVVAGTAFAVIQNFPHYYLLNALPTQVVTIDNTAGSGVDLRYYTGTVAAILDSGAASGDNTATMTMKFQHSDTDNTSLYADISGVTFIAVDNTAASQQMIVFNKDDVKRYVRAVTRITGSSGSFTCSVNLIGRRTY